MDASDIGRLLVYLGLGLAAIGGVVWGLGRFVSLGDLPGDFAYRGENVRIYVPLGTMLVVSLVLTLLVNLVMRLLR
jgi:hypothetical protein